jgi:hypothetical protein
MVDSVLRNNIISAYLEWQFFDAPRNILTAWKNYLKFNLNYFSVPLLLRTLISPWHRYHMSYGKRFDPGRYVEAFVFNMMSRVIGFFLRIFFIFFGLLIEIFLVMAGLILFLGWLILPLLLVASFLYGFGIIF